MKEIVHECHSFRLSNGLGTFSPNGLFSSICNQQRLTIFLVTEFKQIRVIQCSEIIEDTVWSADSELILSAYLKKGKLDVWSVIQPDWRCRISMGSLGLHNAQFAPSSRHVLVTTNLHVIFAMKCDQIVSHINLPKDASPGIDFSLAGTYMAVAERRNAQDCVAIYACDTWTQLTLIDDGAVDIGGVKWSPDGSKLAVWDGSHSGKLSIYLVNGSKLTELPHLFGIHFVQWSPSAQILATSTVGSKVKLINHLSWNPIVTLSHSKKVHDAACILYCECGETLKCKLTDGLHFWFAAPEDHEIIEDRPFTLPGEPSSGKLQLHFSRDARFLVVFDEQRPRVLWIWELPYFSLNSVLVQCSAIKCFKWSNTGSRLAIVCGTGCVYIWTPTGSAVTDLRSLVLKTANMKANRAEWSLNDKYLMISGKDVGCVCKFK